MPQARIRKMATGWLTRMSRSPQSDFDQIQIGRDGDAARHCPVNRTLRVVDLMRPAGGVGERGVGELEPVADMDPLDEQHAVSLLDRSLDLADKAVVPGRYPARLQRAP